MAIFNARSPSELWHFAGVVALVYALIYYLYLRKDEIKLINNKKILQKKVKTML